MLDKNLVSHTLKASDFESIFESIMHYSKDGIFVTDHEGTILMVNRATEDMVDFAASEILGLNASDMVTAGYYDKSVAMEVIRTGKPVSMIQLSRNKKRILATGIPIHDEYENLKFVLVNDRDITSLENLTDTLEQELLKRDHRFEFSKLGIAATELQDMIVKSPAMHEVIKTAIRAAKLDLTLVITGQSGVGKSMIARAVHRLSERRNGQFIELNCGAISETLLESELFGHEKGAFTGASQNGKKGLFEIAENGTLFLDEVGEIPLHLQVKLLKFLEAGEVIRVGGLQPIKINTRVIAATNRNLEEMVNDRTFRSDLYYRLNVVPLHIPALGERKEEIPYLLDFFLNRFNREFDQEKTFSRAAKNALQSSEYKGNIRELENLVKRLVAMTEEDVISLKHLPDIYRKSQSVQDTNRPEHSSPLHDVKAFEIHVIKDAVKKYGSQRKAAKKLGINQSTISKKLRAY